MKGYLVKTQVWQLTKYFYFELTHKYLLYLKLVSLLLALDRKRQSFGHEGKVHIFWEGYKILRNLHLTLSYVVPVKSKVEISQNFVAFSEYMNFSNKFAAKVC
jgi:hypothetical protein